MTQDVYRWIDPWEEIEDSREMEDVLSSALQSAETAWETADWWREKFMVYRMAFFISATATFALAWWLFHFGKGL